MAIEFDGVDDSINCGNGASLNTLSEISIILWAYPTSLSGTMVLLDKGEALSTGWFLVIDQNTTANLDFAASFNSDNNPVERISANNVLTLNKWNFICLTWDGSITAANVHMYVNNSEVSYSSTTNGSGTRDSDNTKKLYIGNDDTSQTNPFSGLITEVAVWSTVLSSGEITTLYNSGAPIKGNPLSIESANLVGYWAMNNGPYNKTANLYNIPDTSGNANNGTGSWGANASGLLWAIENPPFPYPIRKSLTPNGTRINSRQVHFRETN